MIGCAMRVRARFNGFLPPRAPRRRRARVARAVRWAMPNGVALTLGRYSLGLAAMAAFQSWAGFVAGVAIIVAPAVLLRR